MADEWTYWREALKGNFGPVHDGDPQAGYWKTRRKGAPWEAVATWRTADGVWHCLRNGKPCIAAEMWSYICTRPISYDLYQAAMKGEPWPDDIEGHIKAEAAAQAPPDAYGEIGHNSGETRPLHEQVLEEVQILRAAFDKWLASIGGSVATEEHDAAADNWKAKFLALEQRADTSRKAEKAPVLELSRQIDSNWKLPESRASEGKRAVVEVLTPYRVKREEAKRAIEAKRREAELAAQAAQQQALAENASAPPMEPAPAPSGRRGVAKLPTGLRTVKVATVTDALACATFLLTTAPNHPDIVEVLAKVARRVHDAGTTVPGFEVRETQVAS